MCVCEQQLVPIQYIRASEIGTDLFGSCRLVNKHQRVDRPAEMLRTGPIGMPFILLYPPDDWYSWACFIQNASQGDDDAGYGRVLTNHCLIFSHYFTCCAVLIVLVNDFCFSSHPLLKMPSIFYTVSSLSGLFVAHSFSKHHSYALSPFETYP